MTLIAFVGSVFSPYYAWARKRGDADPTDHCAMNIALYGKDSQRWCMTERLKGQLRRSASILSIGRSQLRWSGEALEVEVDEICAPLPRRVRGKIRLIPSAMTDRSFSLDGAGRHQWTPFAPCSRVEVELTQPALKWSGSAYFDANSGSEPLEAAFTSWNWSRTSLPNDSIVLYDTRGRETSDRSLALRISASGNVETVEPPPVALLPTSRWHIERETRADAGTSPRVIRTLEDAPFYSRSLLDNSLFGNRATTIHESVNLNRFKSRWVQCLLPFRMPRMVF